MRISDWSSDVCSSDLLTKRSEDGGAVKSHLDGSRHLLSPARSIEIQRLLGSNIVMAFDELVPTTATREVKAAALDRSMRWAKLSRDAFIAGGTTAAHKEIFCKMLRGSGRESWCPRVKIECEPGYVK